MLCLNSCKSSTSLTSTCLFCTLFSYYVSFGLFLWWPTFAVLLFSVRNGFGRLWKSTVRPGVLASVGKQFVGRFVVDADRRMLQSELFSWIKLDILKNIDIIIIFTHNNIVRYRCKHCCTAKSNQVSSFKGNIYQINCRYNVYTYRY